MKDDLVLVGGGFALGAVTSFFLAFFMGISTGLGQEKARWEDRLVDAPHEVAAIRSRVLAERAEEDAKAKTCSCEVGSK